MNLVQELQNAIVTLDTMISQMKSRGQDYAQARADYEIAKAEKMLALRDDGIAVTATRDLALGDRKVAQLRLKKDVAETLYKTVQEAIQTQKLKLRLMESQLQREWGK